MTRKTLSLLVALTLALPLALDGSTAAAKKKEKLTPYQKPVKMLIGAIRYKKDDLALKMLALTDMSQGLLTKHWAKMSAAQQKEFVDGLATLLKKLSFTKARELFEHIDAILYDPPQVQGDRVTLKSTIVVHRAYKKKELVLTWTLLKKGKSWQIYDVKTVGESTVKGIREEQVEPLIKEGGIALLMKKLREKVKEVTSK